MLMIGSAGDKTCRQAEECCRCFVRIEEDTQMKIEGLVNEARHRLAVLRESERRFSRQLAPRFDMFEAFRFGELELSRCLAILLDPRGSHGQGPLYLEAFLRLLDTKNAAADLLDCAPDNATVEVEAVIDGQRRIDLLIRSGRHLIGIENKPWAIDQSEQLKAYGDWLTTRAQGSLTKGEMSGDKSPCWRLVYLANGSPSEFSIAKDLREKWLAEGTLIQIDFAQVEAYLAEVLRHTQAPVVRCFIEQLIRRIHIDINGELEMSEEDEIRDLLVKDKTGDRIEAAIALVKALPRAQAYLIKKLADQLKSKWDPFGDLEFDETKARGEAYLGFVLKRTASTDLVVSFEFDQPGFRGFMAGLRPSSGKLTDQGDIASRVETASDAVSDIFRHRGRSEYYACWSYAGDGFLDPAYRNWCDHPEPWRDIEQDALADKLVEIANDVYEKALGDSSRQRGSEW
jgi:hypothetical protein